MPAPVSRESADGLLPRYYSRPGQLRQEYAVDHVLQMATVPAEVVLQQRPPAPQMLMPPKYGYRTTPLTIADVLATDRFAPRFRSWVSGAPGMPEPRSDPTTGYQGTQRNSLSGGITSGGAVAGAAW